MSEPIIYMHNPPVPRDVQVPTVRYVFSGLKNWTFTSEVHMPGGLMITDIAVCKSSQECVEATVRWLEDNGQKNAKHMLPAGIHTSMREMGII